MGNEQSINRRYHRLSDPSALLSQPLLKNENKYEEAEHVRACWEKCLALEKETLVIKSSFSRLKMKVESNISNENKYEEAEHVRACWEKCLALEKETLVIKSSFSRLKKKVESNISKLKPESISASQGKKEKKAITSLEKEIGNLKLSIASHKADKATLREQGESLKKSQEKNTNLEKKISEMESRVNEMTSTMADMAAVIAEMKSVAAEKREKPKSIEDINTTISENDLLGFLIILIFFVGTLIGISL